jgi:hypothetical protein
VRNPIPPRAPTARRRLPGLLIAALALALAGCQPQRQLELKYRPGKRAVDQFSPSHVAVIPAGDTSARQLFVGNVFDPDGNVERMMVLDPPDAISRLVASDFDHKGLKATVLPMGSEIPDGIDFVVSCDPQELTVVKRVDRASGTGEQSFLMKARARLKCTLKDREGKVIMSDQFSSVEMEPPLGEAGSGRPIISDPGDALSAAVSDAVDAFMNNPDFRRALPSTTASTDFPPPAPSVAASPSPSASPIPPAGNPAAQATH